MAVLMVAGSGRGAGKTAVGCAVIQSLPELCWTAVKVTPHTHLASPVWKGGLSSPRKDTDRYLESGARQSFLVASATTPEASLATLMASTDGGCPNRGLLIESNRVDVHWLTHAGEPSLLLALLSGIPSDWKPSLIDRAVQADALVLTGGFCGDQLPSAWRTKHVFQMVPGSWSSPELLRFVRRRFLP